MLDAAAEEYAVQEMTDIEEMLAALRVPGEPRHIHFRVGKLGRVNMFWLREGMLSDQRTIAELTVQPEEETLAALRTIDAAVSHDADTMWGQDCTILQAIANKAAMLKYGNPTATPLYERRLAEQEAIFKGKLKRGHKAFGFYPLDGYK